ncbi:MAG TPA: hypothetical protein VJ738_08970 [Steroidobacteraceae bacterium]|nr:hypothetical protein [Steroidobacteraceae bacterium]
MLKFAIPSAARDFWFPSLYPNLSAATEQQAAVVRRTIDAEAGTDGGAAVTAGEERRGAPALCA